MRSARLQADQPVTHRDGAAVDDLAAFDDADAEAVPGRSRLCRRTPAFPRFRRRRAHTRPASHARAMPLITRSRDVDVEARCRVVVEKQERLAAGDQHIVHAHRNEILTPTPSCRSWSIASFNLVLTPSVPVTSTGSR